MSTARETPSDEVLEEAVADDKAQKHAYEHIDADGAIFFDADEDQRQHHPHEPLVAEARKLRHNRIQPLAAQMRLDPRQHRPIKKERKFHSLPPSHKNARCLLAAGAFLDAQASAYFMALSSLMKRS